MRFSTCAHAFFNTCGGTCFFHMRLAQAFWICGGHWKWSPRHKPRNCHESSPRESCEFIDQTNLHRISVQTFLWWRRFLGSGSTFGAGDINIETVTKIVPVRAVDLSIGPFCTEFRCKRFCGNDAFRIGFGKSTPIQKKQRRGHKNVRTKILCRMVRSRGRQLTQLPWQFLYLCLRATFVEYSVNFWRIYF